MKITSSKVLDVLTSTKHDYGHNTSVIT